MVKKTLLVMALALSVVISHGQSFTKKTDSEVKTFISMDVNPVIYVVVDSIHHEIDAGEVDDIKTLWIEKTMIMKDKTTKKLYGNKNGVVFIYTKPEYRDEVIAEIRKNDNSSVNDSFQGN